MTTLYLHVGTPKTGTSYLQNFLGDNRKVLNKQGFIFPDFQMRFEGIGKSRNAHFLITADEKAEEIYQASVAQLQEISKQYEKIILSEEGLWNNDKNIAKFVSDMKKNDIEIKIVVYLRRQDLYIQSKWAQNVKENMEMSFYEYIQSKQKKGLNYYKKLNALAEIVGKENMLVRVYEKQQFVGKNKDLLSDFLETTGIAWDEEFKILDSKRNPSLTGIYLETKQKLNRYPEFATKKNFVVPHLYAVMEKKNELSSYSENKYFTYEQQMEFLGKYAKGNQKIAEEFLGRKDGVLFQEEIVPRKGEEDSYSPEEFFDVLAEVIIMQQKEMQRVKELVETEKEAKNYWKKQAEERVINKISRKMKHVLGKKK